MIKSSIHKIKNNPIKYFLLKLVVFFAIVFVLDYSIGNILRYFYFKQESGLQYRTTYSLEKTNAEILIFGSSRANHHYVPDVFENGLNLSFYNVGRDGNSILYHSAVLKGILKRYSPKIVILDFDSGEFSQNKLSYERLSSLLPYYYTHQEIRPIIELKSKFERIKMLSFIYPYNSSMFTIAVGNTEFNKKRRSDIKGYVPLTKIWDGSVQTDSSAASYEIDSIKVKVYETFIKDCIHSKAKLFIVCSPYLIESNHTDYSIILAKEIAKRNNVSFFDYSNDTAFISNPKLFADAGHLNQSGAEIFSNMLIEKLTETKIAEPVLSKTTLH